MKINYIFPLLILLVGCIGTTSDAFDKDYYEKTTKIKFPKSYRLVASVDNGEYLTITILDLNKTECRNFVRDNNFEPPYRDTSSRLKSYPDLSGLFLLDTSYRKLPDKNLLVREKLFENGTGWTYYIDTVACRLYCQINYPDKEGN